MNNKPVAWMHQNPDYAISKHQSLEYNIPLYTHPVKELDEQFKKGFEAGKEEGWKAHKFHHPVKELTDEEITDVFVECLLPDGEFEEHEFARAILRKAQEK